MTTADTMRELIKQARLSQREAANEIGVTQRTFRDVYSTKNTEIGHAVFAYRKLPPVFTPPLE